ncbi:helix-turn-helix domain-containing protein [Thermogemmatispora carboxidivorans]|uniref:helix-turn-helix domain-containing protein n=1 Tax=Thermogemmatispora carboxidivorans TaxID=1382306 RepID=UPI0006999084|nr:helix-turn-helix transcriptional regulator [Thermogemmatispora carboxidivorans]
MRSGHQARDLGLFVANLRAQAGLSLTTLASLVGSSKSTLSRLEQGQIPLPARGKNRMLLIALVHLLCSAASERDRILSLASIDPALLTLGELIVLGLWPPSSPHGIRSLPHEDVEQGREEVIRLLTQLEEWMRKPAVSHSEQVSTLLRRKIARYRALLEELEQQLTWIQHTSRPGEPGASPEHRTHLDQSRNMQTGTSPVEKQSQTSSSSALSPDLFNLASARARWLMQQAGVERFAVDDCIVLTASEGFRGWDKKQIQMTTLAQPWPLPEDLAAVLREQRAALEESALNAPHYQLVSLTPAWSELDCLKLVMAPLRFYDYAALLPILDKPLLASQDGRLLSIREQYGSTALYTRSYSRNAALIPAPVSIQCLLETQDERLVLVQRSEAVAFYPGCWSASFEETMNAPGLVAGSFQPGDAHIFDAAYRGLEEEFGLPADAVEEMKALSLNVEYPTLSVDVFMLIKLARPLAAVKERWLISARHRDEALQVTGIACRLDEVVATLFAPRQWHPTSRMRLIQWLIQRYGLDAVMAAIREQGQGAMLPDGPAQEERRSGLSEATGAVLLGASGTARDEREEVKPVIGAAYGAEQRSRSDKALSLSDLAAPEAVQFMQEAGIDSLAVDGLIMLTSSAAFQGWLPADIVTRRLATPLPVPEEVEYCRQRYLPRVAAHFTNSSHYRLVAYTPAFSDRRGLEVMLAPIGFHDYYPLAYALDEPLLEGPTGPCSLRQKYGATALHYLPPASYPALPMPVSLQGVVLTSDQQVILMRRSEAVAFYPGCWSVSFEETMNAPGLDPRGRERSGDSDFFACARRGIREEFGLGPEAIEEIRILSLNLEYWLLAVAVVAVIRLRVPADEVRMRWLLQAADRDEAAQLSTFPPTLEAALRELASGRHWHPTARMRLLQVLFHLYGVDEVQRALADGQR